MKKTCLLSLLAVFQLGFFLWISGCNSARQATAPQVYSTKIKAQDVLVPDGQCDANSCFGPPFYTFSSEMTGTPVACISNSIMTECATKTPTPDQSLTPVGTNTPTQTQTPTPIPPSCNISGGTNDLTLHCDGIGDSAQFRADVSPLGGIFQWTASSGLKVIGQNSNDIFIVEANSPSGSMGDQSVNLKYSLNGLSCTSVTNVTVHKPGQLRLLFPISFTGWNYLDDQGGIIGFRMVALPLDIQLVDQLNLPMPNVLVSEVGTEVNAAKTTKELFPLVKQPHLGSATTDDNGEFSDSQYINVCCTQNGINLNNVQVVIDHQIQVLGCSALSEDTWSASTASFNPFNITESFPLNLQ